MKKPYHYDPLPDEIKIWGCFIKFVAVIILMGAFLLGLIIYLSLLR